MKRIGILSDTHGALPERFEDFFADVDEIWHAGDIGSTEVINRLEAYKPLRAVSGNIDDAAIRQKFPEILIFNCESMKVLLTHIGGYLGKYDARARQLIISEKPALFVCGHSHILKVIYDKKYNLLHINPGAAGNSGLHKQITMIRCEVDSDRVVNLEVFDKPRGNPTY